jgi:hypothetical protein
MLAMVQAEAQPIQFGSHFYEFVPVAGISWQDANAAASGRTFNGTNGYLATILSAAENSFLSDNYATYSSFAGAWLGGQVNSDDTGYWAVGPEAGQVFSQVQQAVGGAYANWGGIEPNNAPSAPYMNIGTVFAGIQTGQWADAANGVASFPGDPVQGFFVEYDIQTNPSVQTLGPTMVSNLSATLNGSVNPNGLSTTAWFQYGGDTNYGDITASTNIGNGQDTVQFATTLSNLTGNQVFHYRAVAASGANVLYGQDMTFTTMPSELVLAELASDVYNDSVLGSRVLPGYNYLYSYSDFVPTPPPPTGFDVGLYASIDGTQVVIAFRGTMFQASLIGMANLNADYGFGSGNPTSELQQYCEAAALFVSQVQQYYNNANITLTGHSLGGALALMVGKASGISAIGFNAPESGDIFYGLLPELDPVNWPTLFAQNVNINVRIDGDIVSETGTPFASTDQYPSVVTLASPYNLPAVPSSMWGQSVYLMRYFDYIVSLHGIDIVIKQIAANASNSPGLGTGPNLASVF